MQEQLDQRRKAAERVTIIGAVLDTVLGVLKILIGVIANSSALIADGIHSLSDLLTDFMVVAVLRLSHQAPDDNHPYGHARFETVGTVALGVVLVAVGGAMAGVDAVLAGPDRRAFCATRPPGHHAAPCRPSGFCIFNNVAIAAYHAVHNHGIERVAIVDFDVHHGDGTEQIVAGSAPILFCSSFQHPFYPYSGIPPLADNCLPAPIRNLSDGAAYRQAIREAGWFDRLAAFRPQLLLFSAGFDAHKDDPLGGLILEAEDFAWITRETIAAVGTDVPVVSLLEGGYELKGLEDSLLAHFEAMNAG